MSVTLPSSVSGGAGTDTLVGTTVENAAGSPQDDVLTGDGAANSLYGFDGADANLLALGREGSRLPRALEQSLVELLASHAGTKAADLGDGIRAVREYDRLRLEGTVRWGPWTLSSEHDGLEVRGRLPGDRLAGRRKKVQDLLVDAKVPRAERDAWPLVVCGDEVVSVPGIAEAPGWEGVVPLIHPSSASPRASG